MASITIPARVGGETTSIRLSRVTPWLTIVVCTLGFLILFGLAALSRARLIYDEPLYLKPIALLKQHGLSLAFLRLYPEPAGLLHNVLHWALEPWTGLKPPLIRLVNPVLLAFTTFLTYRTLRLLGSAQPLSTSLTLIGVPFIWVLTGLVLTELPALFLSTLSVYLLLWARNSSSERTAAALIAAFGGGMALGSAFLSRAPVLVMLGALPFLVGTDWRRSIRLIAAFVSGTLLIAAPVLAVWGGLTPPHSAVPVSTSSFSLYNMMLSFAYAATAMLILAPGWFALRARWIVLIGGVVVLLNGLTAMVEIHVARSVVARLPAIFSVVVPRLAGSAMLGLAALFFVCSLKHLYERRRDTNWLFLCAVMLLMVIAPGKITHQFSSRYTALASGTMVLVGDSYAQSTAGRAIRTVVGMLIGLTSLLSYYAMGTP